MPNAAARQVCRRGPRLRPRTRLPARRLKPRCRRANHVARCCGMLPTATIATCATGSPRTSSSMRSGCAPAPRCGGVSSNRCVRVLPESAYAPPTATSHARRNGWSSNGRKTKQKRAATGSRRTAKTCPSPSWSNPAKPAGGSNATIRNSNRSSDWATTKGATGAVSIIMRAGVSRRMGS